MPSGLIILDVVGTLIPSTGIDRRLPQLLRRFTDNDYIIVLASTTENCEDTYKDDLEIAGVTDYVSAYQPSHCPDPTNKRAQIEQYINDFKIDDRKTVYFFDDVGTYIRLVSRLCKVNTYQITKDHTLANQLHQLANNLSLNPKTATHLTPFYASSRQEPRSSFHQNNSENYNNVTYGHCCIKFCCVL